MIHQKDVIYGRKYGMALTMDVLIPAEPNGRGVILVIAGGWKSNHDTIAGWKGSLIAPFLERGYTVFAAVPCSGPRFTIPDLVDDIHRAVRFVRANAATYGVDPGKLGISGFSAGGHLALTVGIAARPGDLEAEDPIERESSQVQAIAQFYGPTDFLNYGEVGENALEGRLKDLAAAFDFQEFDAEEAVFHSVKDKAAIMRRYSPFYLIHEGVPPTLFVHGDQDFRVPLQQSQTAHERLKEVGVATELIVKPGGGHSWEGMEQDVFHLTDWFDEHLA